MTEAAITLQHAAPYSVDDLFEMPTTKTATRSSAGLS
jgi:hypothetical protein